MTLAETLVAVSVLALGIAGVSKLIVMSQQLSDMARDKKTASQLAMNRIQRMSMMSYSAIPLWASSNLTVNADGTSDSDGNFLLATSVTEFPTNQGEAVQISIEVYTRNRKTWEFDRDPSTFETILAKELIE